MIKTVIPILCMCTVISCAAAPQLREDAQYDFTTTGFLDDSSFQITAKDAPDPAAKGLVAQRESAVIKARNGLQTSAVTALVEYRLALYAAQLPASHDRDYLISSARGILAAEFRKYLAYGSIIEEYYEKDNAATVVYRISKSGLRKEVESHQIAFPDKKEESK